MRKIQKTLIVLFVAAIAIACGESKKEKTVSGIIEDATMNNVVVTTADGSVWFSTTDADKSEVNGMLIGDTITVTYEGEISKDPSVSVTAAKKIVVKPAFRFDRTVVGKWLKPIEGQNGEDGIHIKENGIAESINSATLVYESWMCDDNKITLIGESIGNGQTIDFSETYTIDKVDNNTLILISDDGTVTSYHKH